MLAYALGQVKEDSGFTNSPVNYSAAGEGNIALKVQGKRKLLHTANLPEEFIIDKALPENDAVWQKLNEKFKKYFDFKSKIIYR